MKIIKKYIVSIILLVISIAVFSSSFIPFYQKDLDYYDRILDKAYEAHKPYFDKIDEYEQKMNNSYGTEYFKYADLWSDANKKEQAFYSKEIKPYLNLKGEIYKKRNNIELILRIASGGMLFLSIVSFFLTKQAAKKKEKKQDTQQTDLTQADELKKYKELLDMGALTQEEFDQKKKQLLGL